VSGENGNKPTSQAAAQMGHVPPATPQHYLLELVSSGPGEWGRMFCLKIDFSEDVATLGGTLMGESKSILNFRCGNVFQLDSCQLLR